MITIDLNSDVGESFGRYQLGNDAGLFPYITSANIACGFHAGDPLVMQRTVHLALENGTAIGAHPGYPDIQGFGRRQMDLTAEELEVMVLYQVSALAGVTRASGGELIHVKPHGAMYNHAAKDIQAARAIARGVARFSKSLILVGLAGSALIEAGIDSGLRVANEGFPERQYNTDGTLMSRKQPGSTLTEERLVAEQAVRLVKEGIKFQGGKIQAVVCVDTLCIHGDNPAAIVLTKAIRQKLADEGIGINRLGM